jgi:hypothetical protein
MPNCSAPTNTVPFRRSISTAAVDFAAIIRKLHAASVFVADHAIDCVVLPSFSHNGASKATMFAVFAFDAVSRAFGNARFAASLRDIDTRNATYVAVSAAHGRKKTDAASNCFNSCGARALDRCPCLDDRLRAILHFALGQLTPKFACSADGGVIRKIGTRGVGLTRYILRSKSIKVNWTGGGAGTHKLDVLAMLSKARSATVSRDSARGNHRRSQPCPTFADVCYGQMAVCNVW